MYFMHILLPQRSATIVRLVSHRSGSSRKMARPGAATWIGGEISIAIPLSTRLLIFHFAEWCMTGTDSARLPLQALGSVLQSSTEARCGP